ncbi:hypothetical protein HG536_0F03530 [Torulaspora globosa]|uniref:Uncharacterized protein n=1 Tax=Torulaspora globosa TaxID=48254 RepID=A0A7G3ZKJ2_9SACH|nr:uncharacterized protein HG536_0F03530 [Torulaspora globosa]QLL34028.1 hypothetical protein HG536_0F03530 [Torulaspora globosa]
MSGCTSARSSLPNGPDASTRSSWPPSWRPSSWSSTTCGAVSASFSSVRSPSIRSQNVEILDPRSRASCRTACGSLHRSSSALRIFARWAITDGVIADARLADSSGCNSCSASGAFCCDACSATTGRASKTSTHASSTSASPTFGSQYMNKGSQDSDRSGPSTYLAWALLGQFRRSYKRNVLFHQCNQVLGQGYLLLEIAEDQYPGLQRPFGSFRLYQML